MTDAERLAGMAAQGLRLEPPPSEDEIEEIVARLSLAFSVGEDASKEAVKMLHARFAIRMELGQTIKDEHVPWLAGRRGSIDPFYWTRYHELLLRNGWPPTVAGTLDRS